MRTCAGAAAADDGAGGDDAHAAASVASRAGSIVGRIAGS
jgi:hypothetical protein